MTMSIYQCCEHCAESCLDKEPVGHYDPCQVSTCKVGNAIERPVERNPIDILMNG